MEADRPLEAHASLVSEATLTANRAVLLNLRGRLAMQGHPAAGGGAWELVIAEALNNIVEHAYGGRGSGEIRIDVRWTLQEMSVVLTDDGIAMPDAPKARPLAPSLDCATEDLPEGGFGWRIIEGLTTELTYSREGTQNRFAMVIPFGKG